MTCPRCAADTAEAFSGLTPDRAVMMRTEALCRQGRADLAVILAERDDLTWWRRVKA